MDPNGSGDGAGNHADFGAIWSRSFGAYTGDEPMKTEQVNDMEARLAAEAVVEACGGNSKKLALAAGKSPRTGRRWANAHRSTPLYRVRKILASASIAHRWAIICELAAVAVRADIGDGGPMPEWRWRHLMRETLREEQETDGDEDCVTQAWLQGEATHADLRSADARHAQHRLRRMALLEIGIREGYTLRDGDE